jgi:hypothetical protein
MHVVTSRCMLQQTAAVLACGYLPLRGLTQPSVTRSHVDRHHEIWLSLSVCNILPATAGVVLAGCSSGFGQSRMAFFNKAQQAHTYIHGHGRLQQATPSFKDLMSHGWRCRAGA